MPDLICVLDAETAEPITTEGLRYGQRVRVLENLLVRAGTLPPGAVDQLRSLHPA